jgi:hypothetical protein
MQDGKSTPQTTNISLSSALFQVSVLLQARGDTQMSDICRQTQEALDALESALGLIEPARASHARHNLDGALIDIEHADGRADEVCRRTIRRVIGQLAEVERILGRADGK